MSQVDKNLATVLVALFYPNPALDCLVANGGADRKLVNDLLMAIPKIRRSKNDFHLSEEFLNLSKEINGNNKFQPGDLDVHLLLDIIFSRIFMLSPHLKYLHRAPVNFHTISISTEASFCKLEELLTEDLTTDKFTSEPVPLLIVRIIRPQNEIGDNYILLPLEISLQNLVQDGSTASLKLVSVICKSRGTNRNGTKFVYYKYPDARGGQWGLYSVDSQNRSFETSPQIDDELRNLNKFHSIEGASESTKLICTRSEYYVFVTVTSEDHNWGFVQPKQLPSYGNTRKGNDRNTRRSYSVEEPQSKKPKCEKCVIDPYSKIGERKGIEGDQNSCSLDALLMAMFYSDSNFNKEILNHIAVNDNAVFGSLLEIVQKITEKPYQCSKSTAWELRKQMQPFNPKVIGEMMDVDEFTRTLFGTCLKSKFFINYQLANNPSVTTGNYWHQIMCPLKSPSDSNESSVKEVLLKSMKFQNLKFSKPPGPLLLIKMPRANGQLVGYSMIYPDPVLDITDLMSENFQNDCSYTLQAIVCIRHMHYTAFIKVDNGNNQPKWTFYNSITYNGSVVEDLGDFQSLLDDYGILAFDELDTKYQTEIRGIHWCVYRSKQLPSEAPTIIINRADTEQPKALTVSKVDPTTDYF